MSETNNDFFTVEKTTDGVNFEQVGIVAGAGSSNYSLSYSLYDEYPSAGISYYRLKQTDYDASYSYSQMVPIEYNKGEDVLYFDVYPNPSKAARFNIRVIGNENDALTITVVDMLGRDRFRETSFFTSGLYKTQVDQVDFAPGVYVVNVESNNKTVSKKIVIIR